MTEHDPDFESKVTRLGRALAQLPEPRQLTFLDIIEAEKEKECPRPTIAHTQPMPSTPSK